MSQSQRRYRQLFFIGLIAIAVGLAGQWILGGLWLQEGFAAFLWSRFGLECARFRILEENQNPWLKLQRANIVLHLIMAVGGTYALNAVVIDRYFQ